MKENSISQGQDDSIHLCKKEKTILKGFGSVSYSWNAVIVSQRIPMKCCIEGAKPLMTFL